MKKVVLRSAQKAAEKKRDKKVQLEFKPRSILEYKGLQWRYDKTYGEWRPLKANGIRAKRYVHSILGTSFPRDGWKVSGAWGGTPLEALKAYTEANIKMHQRDLKDLQDRVKEEKIAIRAMRSKRWA